KSSPSTTFVPPSRNDWDLLFQLMFDELLKPPPSVYNQALEVIALIPDVIPLVQDDSTGSPSSTTVNPDASSLSKSHTTAETQSSIIPQDVEKENLDIKVTHMGNDPLLGVPILAWILRWWRNPNWMKINRGRPLIHHIIVDSSIALTAFADADHAGCPDTRRSTSGSDSLFQPMFDELLNPPPSVANQAPKVIAPIAEVIPPVHADSVSSPSSTTVDQDAPSPIIPQDVGDDNLDIEVAHMGNDPLFGAPIPKVTSAQSSSTASPQSNVQSNHQMPHHNSKWTKDHPLNNIIDQLSRLVSTRLQLHEQALFCYYDAFLASVEPRTYKEALTQSCWIEAM
nr:hypothetical protein [Tanacetum cinerariifolium]